MPWLAAGIRDGNRAGEGFEQRVHDALRRFHVSAGHRRGQQRVYDGAFGRDHANRSHQAGRGGHFFIQQAAEHVENGGLRDGSHGIDAAGALRRAAREIDFRIFPANANGHGDAQGLLVTPSSSRKSSAR